MVQCKNCGKQLPDGTKFCYQCGAKLEAAAAAQNPAQPQSRTEQFQQQKAQQAQAQQAQQENYQQQAQQNAYQQNPQYQQQAQQNAYQQNPQYQQQYSQNAYQQNPQYQQQYQQNAYAAAAPVSGVSFKNIYARAFGILKQKPIRLWGVSLMCSLLSSLACVFGVLPIIWLPICWALQMGMTAVYLCGIVGKEVSVDQLFEPFKNGKFLRCIGAMAWMNLWILIWALIPIAGPIIAVVKSYSYRFTPYLVLENDDLSVTDALRRSMDMTDGIKGQMFWADVLIAVIVAVANGVLGALGSIPYIGILFVIVDVIVMILVAIFEPLLLGLIAACFYDEKKQEDLRNGKTY